MQEYFRDKTFVVTGAASGIGEAVARRLVAMGGNVVAFDLHSPGPGSACEFVEFDQGEFSSISTAVQRAPKRIDGLFNVAGAAPSDRLTVERLLLINYYGVRRLTEALADRLSDGGAIVNMSSHAGHRWKENAPVARAFLNASNLSEIAALVAERQIKLHGLDDRSAYPLSKQLLNLWTVGSLSFCQSRGVRMNAVAAAGVKTPILDKFLESFGEDSAARIQSIGVACPDDVAGGLVFLASPASSWIKSAVIAIDGGASALAAAKQLDIKIDG